MNYYKKLYVEYIYDKLCYSYLKNEDVSIKKLEKILFLVNAESIEKEGFDFLKCKTFYYDNSIRIEYLSDLFRVMKPQEIQKNRIFKIKRIDRVSTLMEAYIRMNEEEMDNIVKFRVNQDELMKVYMEEYKSSRNRKYARMRAYSFARKVRSFENKIVFVFVLPFALCAVFSFNTRLMISGILLLMIFVILFKLDSVFHFKIMTSGLFNDETDFEKELKSKEEQ